MKWKCGLCKKLLGDAAEVDHRVPLSDGGTNSMSNLHVVHSRCHTSRGLTQVMTSGKKVPRKSISPVMKWRLASNNGWKCGLCKKLLGDDAEVDHRVPLSNGGTNSMSNLQVVHSRCHARKTHLESSSRNSRDVPFCFYCDVYFSKYFMCNHIHA